MASERPPIADEFLERFRGYLSVLAELHMGRRMREKLDPCDIVQQTLLDAYQFQERFRGSTDAEVKAWLRKILTCNIVKQLRLLGRQKRDIERERSLEQAMEASSVRLDQWLVANGSSPSRRERNREDTERLAAALAQLPEAQRQALILRHLQGWSLTQIGEHLGKTLDAVAGLIKRGTMQLREALQQEE